MKVIILRDIQLRERGHVFTKKCSRIEYDAKKPIDKKLHQLVHQQGERYGTVGDCCEYLSHQQLEYLEAAGYVRIDKKNKPRRRVATLAEVLYAAHRRAVDNKAPAWEECLPSVWKQWEEVADAGRDWAYEHIEWQE